MKINFSGYGLVFFVQWLAAFLTFLGLGYEILKHFEYCNLRPVSMLKSFNYITVIHTYIVYAPISSCQRNDTIPDMK